MTGSFRRVRIHKTSACVSMAPNRNHSHAFAYVFVGNDKFCNASGLLAVPTEGVKWLDRATPAEVGKRSLILFDCGDEVEVQAGEEGVRFLLCAGKRLEEPVAWYGPSS